MITIAKLKSLIESAQELHTSARINRIHTLKTCILLIQTNPNEIFLRNQLNILENRLKLIREKECQYSPANGKSFKNKQSKRTSFRTESGYTSTANQIETLKLLLEC